ncbi:MAG: 5'-nucleotidase C-terminal domain-containing protein [Clostridiales bacterium]|nr:5'-nucleotidase C-terminal domain-containing protein [Clostridiales bacterium]
MKFRKLVAGLIVAIMVLSSLAMAFAAEAEAVTITIIHTNDIHGRLLEGRFAGMGFAKAATLIEELRSENKNVLLFDAGDTVHGLPIATLDKGEGVIQIMNAMGYDLMVAGNHEFNYGRDRLVELDGIADFPILAGNVIDEEGNPILERYVIKEIEGVKIGIIGVATPETMYKSHPKGVVGLTFVDPVDYTKEVVAEIKDQVDVIIALAHLGTDVDSFHTSIRLAENVPELDIIIDGHSHTKENRLVNDVLIVSAQEYLKYLGVVQFEVKDGEVISRTARLISKEDAAETEENAVVLEVLEGIKAAQDEIFAERVGYTTVKLDGDRADVRSRQTNMGTMITNVFLRVSGAEVAFTNGGGIRASIEAGPISRGDIVKVLPFGNAIEVLEISGADLKAALNHGTRVIEEGLTGSFPQVKGIKFDVDISRAEGDRVINVCINGEPLELDRMYEMATNDFLAAGGDGYGMFAEAKSLRSYMAMEDAVVEFIKSVPFIAPGVVGGATVVEGGVVVEEEVEQEAAVITTNKYVVEAGDMLWKIAKQFGTTWQELKSLNNLNDANLIIIGQELLVPAK